jgi:putative hydrolase of the HAD superfamily
MSFRAVLFDVGGTLWFSRGAPSPAGFRRLAAERAATALAVLGRHGFDPDVVARAAWDSIEGARREWPGERYAEPDYPAEAARALSAVGLRLSREDATALLDAIYVSGPEAGKVADPDAGPVLGELRRRGLMVAIVTNRAFGGPRFRADLRASGLDFPWDAEAVSVEVGYYKPHPAIFERALGDLGVAPAEALMVGDSLAEDVAGAQALGIVAAWRRCQPDCEGVCPDFTFDRLPDLLELPGLAEAR